jgi:M6 family metalloprotease-like protein
MRFGHRLILCAGASLLCVPMTFAVGHIYVSSPPSGAQVGIASTSFIDVPGLTINFFQYQPGSVCINVSAECYTIGNKRMFVRAVVDGETALPTDVILVRGDFRGTHTFQFVANVQGGQHTAVIQYLVDSGGQAQFGDRSLWIATAPNTIQTVAAPSGPVVTTTSSNFQNIPNMSTTITLPQTSDLLITFSAEAEINAGKRMFVRATIDGQAAKPTDVVLCANDFYGTRSFTFAAANVSAGAHTISMQWLVDGGATGYLGDRTMSVGYANALAMQAGEGTLVSVSAPSGASVSTVSSGFSDIPGLAADVYIPPNGQLCVSVSAEAYTSNSKRMFVRAVMDGQLLLPTNVVLSATDFDGVRTFHFVQRQVTGGIHNITLQWLVDGGGTAFMGDRNMSVIAFSAPCPDLNTTFDGLVPVWGDRNVLSICWDPHRPDHPAPPIATIESMLFGSAPSVYDYYIVNSHNRVFINNAGVKGWYNAAKSAAYYWGPEDPADSNGDGWIHPHVEKWAEAIKAADNTFDFSAYDLNGDKTLTSEELVVMIIIPQNGPFGTVRTPLSREYPTAQPLVVDGVTIPLIAEVYAGAPPNLPAAAHELGHALFNFPDMYFGFFMPYAAGAYSLMDISYSDSHLDPFLKIRLGWVQPAMISQSIYIPIDAIELSHIAYILYDPKHGDQEYFIIENRQPDLAYDTHLPDAGLAIWHIIEDPTVYENLSAPNGVSATNWATIAKGDWGRRAIRMLRPVYGPPFNNALALWNGADPATGYDLLSLDPDPSHITLKWADGTPSGFNIKEISAAGQHMTALIEVPGKATVIAPHLEQPIQIHLAQNFPNPFNATTSIRYAVAAPTKVQVHILNLNGQEVRALSDFAERAGEKTITWDGKDNQGLSAASGVYFCRCKADKWETSIKMLLLR